MKKQLFILLFAASFISAAVWFTACQKEETNDVQATELQATDRTPGDAKVFPPTAHPYGQSYDAWLKVWLEQFYTYGCDDVPWVHPESVLFYQSGPVYILAGIAEVGGSANITIPHGKALLFPLVNLWWDICPGDIPPGVPLETYLTEGVESGLIDIDVSSLLVTVDGAAVSNLGSYKFVTDMFDLTGNPELADCFEPCIAGGGPVPTVSGGYYVIVKPLAKGQHTVHYHMEAPAWGSVQDGTYNITVQ